MVSPLYLHYLRLSPTAYRHRGASGKRATMCMLLGLGGLYSPRAIALFNPRHRRFYIRRGITGVGGQLGTNRHVRSARNALITSSIVTRVLGVDRIGRGTAVSFHTHTNVGGVFWLYLPCQYCFLGKFTGIGLSSQTVVSSQHDIEPSILGEPRLFGELPGATGCSCTVGS